MNSLKRILGYALGYAFIFYPLKASGIEISWQMWLSIIIGGTILSVINSLFPDKY